MKHILSLSFALVFTLSLTLFIGYQNSSLVESQSPVEAGISLTCRGYLYCHQ